VPDPIQVLADPTDPHRMTVSEMLDIIRQETADDPSFVEEVIEASKQYAIYCKCGGMPNEGRNNQPFDTEAEAQSELEKMRAVFNPLGSGSIACSQWAGAKVFPYTGEKWRPELAAAEEAESRA